MKQQEIMSGKNQKTKPSVGIALIRNIGVALIVVLLISVAYKKMPGYQWVYDGLLKGNMELMRQYKDLPLEGRNEMKLGYTYAYLRYIVRQTPPDAVILMPQKSIYFPEKVKTEFTGQPYNKLWATRFLYPRKIVLEGEETANKYGCKITHVAIVNGWGYDKLHYEVENPVKNTVLPIDRMDQ